jgi:lipoyl-dependent peroxiredoxin
MAGCKDYIKFSIKYADLLDFFLRLSIISNMIKKQGRIGNTIAARRYQISIQGGVMTELQRSASAVWQGDSRSGNGKITTPSGVLQDDPYTYLTRFDNMPGTNPEELIAAAHAACFSMAFASALKRRGFLAEQLSTQAILTVEKEEIGWTVTKIHLHVDGKVANISGEVFKETAEEAEQGCPISRLLRPGLKEISLEANLL